MEVSKQGLKVEAEHNGYSHLKGKPVHRRYFNFNEPFKGLLLGLFFSL